MKTIRILSPDLINLKEEYIYLSIDIGNEYDKRQVLQIQQIIDNGQQISIRKFIDQEKVVVYVRKSNENQVHLLPN